MFDQFGLNSPAQLAVIKLEALRTHRTTKLKELKFYYFLQTHITFYRNYFDVF
jgi:hypothetical protein